MSKKKRLCSLSHLSKIASREVTVPYVPEKNLDNLINATAQDYFPVNMDEYTLAYNVLETVKEKDKKLEAVASCCTGLFDPELL